MFKINLIIALVVVLLFGLNVSVHADQAAIDQIETAFHQRDAATLEKLTAKGQGYAGHLAGYRLSAIQQAGGKVVAGDNTVQQVAKKLEEHLESEPKDAESWALLASVYGLMIAYEPSRGMSYGPKIEIALGRAYAIDADNPRVLLVDGVSKFNTPEMYGGSKTQAISLLSRAIEAYAHDADSGYHWGLPEAYIWRGIARQAIGESEKAVIDWQQALKISPEHPWAKQLLGNPQ